MLYSEKASVSSGQPLSLLGSKENGAAEASFIGG